MKLDIKKFSKKIFFSGIAGVALLFLGATQFANAQILPAAALLAGPSATKQAVSAAATFVGIGNIQNSVISALIYAVTYLMAGVMGIVIAIEAWLITVVLNINNGIFQTSIVQNGFSISLSIANLAFVLGIIVIAIATILRRESYGIKQLLWKLVVMAILVNFGLVIMAPIFSVGNSLSQYFLNCINPVGGGCSGAGTFTSGSGTLAVVSSYNTFANTFAGAFNPQNAFTALQSATSSVALTTAQLAATNVNNNNNASYAGAFSALGGNVAAWLIPLLGIVFTFINIALIVIVLGAFIILMFIRYIYIAILAILLPFAWTAWVFPSFSHHFQSWWSKFLQWTFFAPIVMFFIYLALSAMSTTNTSLALSNSQGGSAFAIATYMGADNGIWSALSGFLGAQFAAVIESFLQEILLVGLIIGGLIAADTMSVKFAGTVVDAAAAGATYVAAEHGARMGRHVWHDVGGHALTNKLATSKNRYIAGLGRKMSNVQTHAGKVADYKKKLAGMTKEGFMAQKDGGMNEAERMAWAGLAVEQKWGDENMTISGMKMKDIIDDKGAVERTGQSKLKKDADKLYESNTDFRNAERAPAGAMVQVTDKDGIEYEDIDPATGATRTRTFATGASVDKETLMDAAMQKFMRESETEDLAKGDANTLYKKLVPGTPGYAAQQVRMKNLAKYAPQAISKLMPKMSNATRENFVDGMTRVRDLGNPASTDGIITAGRRPIITLEHTIEAHAATLKQNETDAKAADDEIKKAEQGIKDFTQKTEQGIKERIQQDAQNIRDASQKIGEYRDITDVDAAIRKIKEDQVTEINRLNDAMNAETTRLNNLKNTATTNATNLAGLAATLKITADAYNRDLKNLQNNSAYERAHKTLSRAIVNTLEGRLNTGGGGGGSGTP